MHWDQSYHYLLLGIPGAIVLTAVVWAVLHPASDFRISVRPDGVRFRGKLPPGFRPEVAELLQNEMGFKRLTIYGNWTPRRVLRVSFRGQIEPGQQQRIRNYLSASLRR